LMVIGARSRRRRARSRVAGALMAALVALFAAGCTARAPEMASVALADCVQGWFFDAPRSCSACGLGMANSECGPSDCQQLTFTGFVAGGTEYEGIVTYSAVAKTFSTVTTVVQRDYRVTGNGIAFASQSEKAIPVACSATKLTWDVDGFVKTRASPEWSAALADRAPTRSWKAAPVGE